MSKVLIFLAAGFEEIEAVTIIDLLRRAEAEVTIAGLKPERITGSHGITIECDAFIEDVDFSQYGMLILPGGQPGTNNLKSSEKVLETVKRFHSEGKMIAAICAAPTVLVKAGVLKNKRVTSYPSEKSAFNFFDYMESDVVRDGNIITSRGVGTAIDFALELVGILKDEEVKADLAEKILWKSSEKI